MPNFQLMNVSDKLTLLQESLHVLVNNSMDYMAMADAEGNMIYINKAGREQLGLTPDEDITLRHAREFFPPKEYEQMVKNVLPDLHVKGEWKGMIHLKHFVSGEVIPFQASYIPLSDTDTGAFIGRWAILRDLRPELAANHALSASEQQLRTAVEIAQLGTWSIDLTAMKAYFSERVRELYGFTGLSTDLSVGLATIHEKDRERVIANFKRSLLPESGGSYDETYTIRHLITGQESVIHLLARVSFNEKKEAYLVTGTLEDITPQKLMEQELEKQVLLRTDELKQANVALSRSNQELEQFAFVASHDLQEPLRKIRTYCGMLSDRSKGVLDQHCLGYLSRIKASAERMNQLILDLLEFSRIDNKEGLRTRVDLNEVLQKVKEDFELVLQKKHGVIQFQELPVVHAVPLQMNQLFYNLIGNALKFTKTSVPPMVEITARRLSTREAAKMSELDYRNAYWAISVADNGIGFQPAFAEQIFSVFQRLHSQEEYEGTGIGLALCKKIVMAHGGHIYARGEPNSGAIIHIFLPVMS